MKFYKYIQKQQLYNWNAIVNYVAKYICFIKILKKGKKDDIWFEYYIDLTEMDQRLINTIVNEDFNLIQIDHDYQ